MPVQLSAEEHLYDALQVSRAASDQELRTAYRHRALQVHPDKGGTANEFRVIVHAFEVLVDPTQRAHYDKLLIQANSKDGLRWKKAAVPEAVPPFPKRKADEAPAVQPAKKPNHASSGVLDAWRKLKEVFEAGEDLWANSVADIVAGVPHWRVDDLMKEATSALGGKGATKDAKAEQQGDGADEGGDEDMKALCAAQSSNIRGVYSRRGGYGATGYFQGLVFLSVKLDTLEAAIDVHLGLLRLRQLAIAATAAELDLKAAMNEALFKVQQERKVTGHPPLVLAFYVNMSCGGANVGSPSTHSLDTALGFLDEKRRLEQFVDKDAQWRVAVAGWMREKVLVERKAEREERQRVRQRPLQFLQLLKKAVAAHKRVTTQASGLKKRTKASNRKPVPAGVQPVLLPGEQRRFCAVVELDDGTNIQGPMRLSATKAESDLYSLEALRKQGDNEALRIEASRLDEEVMTALFAASLQR